MKLTAKIFGRGLAIALAASMAVALGACSSGNTGNNGGSAPAANTSNDQPAANTSNDQPAENTSGDNGGLAYKGELSIMHFSTSEESKGNGGSDSFRTMNQRWDDAHPDIKLVQNVLANDEFKTKIATLAGANDLPDVFLLQGMNTSTWAQQGLIADLTDSITSSPYAADYDMSKLFPTTYDGKYYSYPVLAEGSCVMVVYDKEMWKEAGFDAFPTTWADVLKANEYFKSKGINTLAFGNAGKWQINSCFLDTVGNRFTGDQWYYDMVNKAGAKFTDQPFVDALKFTQGAFASGVFNPDYNAIGNEEAREYYIAGKAAAFIGGNWDTSYIGATLKDEDPEKYEKTYLAVLPQPEGATATTGTHSTGMGYGVAINAKLTGDKLEAAIDLARYITGKEYATYLAENYAQTGFTKVGNVDLSKFDRFTQDFFKFYQNQGSEIYDSYLTGAVWDQMNTDLQEMINGSIAPETVAENAQKAYEDSYLK